MIRPTIVRIVAMSALLSVTSIFAAATKTQVVQQPNGTWQLLRDGKPFTIKGAGGVNKYDLLAACGGNATRTWGADHLDTLLADAQKNHIAVVVGMWLGHGEAGFNYDDPAAVQRQFEQCKATILKYKDNPAVLAWGIGNEMEGYNATVDPKVWQAVEQIAKFAHENDPNHPTMTVIAEIGKDGFKVGEIDKDCPDIDIIGINSYGGATSLPERYAKAGGTKPYVITEFGPPGTWELGKDDIGVVDEPTSTAKTKFYADTYTKNVIENSGHCLGAFAFLWGFKREATATWFGMFLPDGEKVGAVDAMAKLWSGSYPAERCPEITSLKLDGGKDDVKPGTDLHATLAANDPQGTKMTVDWTLMRDAAATVAGADAPVMEDYPKSIIKGDLTGCDVKMPADGGIYRLYATVHAGQGGAAVANVPIKVEGPLPPPRGQKADLPLVLYSGNGGDSPYIPSGYMGDYAAIHISETATNTHGTQSCQQWTLDKPTGWGGGVCWQSPANDWGSVPGGFDLTGATKLTFWARGAKGGEKVTFGVGIIGADKPFHDTAKAKMVATLTPDWKQYSIDLSDAKDLTMIKTGFYWVISGVKEPTTFYLDNIQFEK